jgi:hypothetical protein
MVKLKKIIPFTKGPRKKLEIKTMRTKVEKQYHQFELNDKIEIFFTKRQRKKNRNQKNEDQIREYNIW